METDFSVMKGKHLKQRELSFPTMGLAALDSMNPKGVQQGKKKNQSWSSHRGSVVNESD